MPIQFQNFTPLVQPHYTMAETQSEKDAENSRKISQINAEKSGQAAISAMNNQAAAAQQQNSLGLQREVNNANVAQQGEVNDQNQQKINADIYNNAESNKLTQSKYATDSANQKLVNERQAKMDEANISNMGLRNQMEAKKEERFAKQDENAQAQLGLENKRKTAEDERTATADKRKTFEQERADAEFNSEKSIKDRIRSLGSVGVTLQLGGDNVDLTKNIGDISTAYGIQVPDGAKLSAVRNPQNGDYNVLIDNKGQQSPLLSTQNNPIVFGPNAQKMFQVAATNLGGGRTKQYMTVKDSNGNEVMVNKEDPNESYTGDTLTASAKNRELRQAQAKDDAAQSKQTTTSVVGGLVTQPPSDQYSMQKARDSVTSAPITVAPQAAPEQVQQQQPQLIDQVPQGAGYTQEEWGKLSDRTKEAVKSSVRRAGLNKSIGGAVDFVGSLKGQGKGLHN